MRLCCVRNLFYVYLVPLLDIMVRVLLHLVKLACVYFFQMLYFLVIYFKSIANYAIDPNG